MILQFFFGLALVSAVVLTVVQRIMSLAETVNSAIGGFKSMLNAMNIHKIKPIINKVFPFEQTLEAFSYLKKGAHMGKVCIKL